MAVSRLTPAVGLKGVFGVSAPFVVGASVEYSVTAVERFTKIMGRGIDLYQELYVPNQIPEDKFNEDVAAGACLITLQPEYGAPIVVPDTYITTYPRNDLYKYRRLILSIDLGPVPNSLDVSYLQQVFASSASDLIGVEPKVDLIEIPLDDTVTPEQHDVNEATRKAKIKTRTTIYAENATLRQQNANLLDTQKRLIQLLEQNGINPTP